jgi:hypothetical protein
MIEGAPETIEERNRVLFERTKQFGDPVYSEEMGLVIRPNHGSEMMSRWGFDVHQSSAWYAVSLARWCRDHANNCEEEQRRLNRIIVRMCEKQERDPESPFYGRIISRWHWPDASQAPNAVNFWLPEIGHLYNHSRDLLKPETEGILHEALELGVEGLNRREVPWRYTNMYLLRVLARFTLARALDRSDVLDQALADWSIWFTETDKTGITEYNSPTYAVVTAIPLGRMLDLLPDTEIAKQVETALACVLADFSWHYHAQTGLLAGAMSRSCHGDFLRNSFSNLMAYQQYGAKIRGISLNPAFVATSNYQQSPESVEWALAKKPGTTVRASIPGSGVRRATYFGNQFALGAKSGPAYGKQEMSVTLVHPSKRQPMLFLRQNPDSGDAVYSELCEGSLLTGIAFRDPPEIGSQHGWFRLVLGPTEDFNAIEVGGSPWPGTYVDITTGTHVHLKTDDIGIDLRFGLFSLDARDKSPSCKVYLWNDYEFDRATIEIVAWGPTLASLALQVTETGDVTIPVTPLWDGNTLSSKGASGPLTLLIPETDGAEIQNEPLLEAPGYVWHPGDWTKSSS